MYGKPTALCWAIAAAILIIPTNARVPSCMRVPPLIGAAILVPLEEISNNLLGGKGAGLTFVVYGAIIVIIARFQPGGILALINRLWARRKAPETKTPETPAAAGAPHAP